MLNHWSDEQNFAGEQVIAKFMRLLQSSVIWATAIGYSWIVWLEN